MPEKTLSELQTDVAVLEERLQQQKEAAEKALILQAREYDKHLAELNGESGRLKNMQATYIPREVYNELEKKVEKLAKWQDVMSGRIIGFGIGWAIIVWLFQWYISKSH